MLCKGKSCSAYLILCADQHHVEGMAVMMTVFVQIPLFLTQHADSWQWCAGVCKVFHAEGLATSTIARPCDTWCPYKS